MLCLLLICAGCAIDDDFVRFRPEARSPFSGVEQPNMSPYSGTVSFQNAVYDFDRNTSALNQYKSVDGGGVLVSARKSEWFVAPEVGVNVVGEKDGPIELRFAEFVAGGRITANFPFTPFSAFGGGGLALLDSTNNGVDASETGFYFHGGGYIHLGDNAHIGFDYRSCLYDDSAFDRQSLGVSLGWNW